MIQAVLLDIDGVLTDGTVSVDGKGTETKRLSFEDIDAVFELKRAGIKIGFLTGEDDGFSSYVRERFEPEFFQAGCKDKLAAFQRLLQSSGLSKESVVYVGDTRKDVALLQALTNSFAPADAEIQARQAARVVLKARRGQGVVREVASRVLESNARSAAAEDSAPYWVVRLDEHLEMVAAIRRDAELLGLFGKIAELAVDCYRRGGKLLICGNGGSATDAQHIAGELLGRFFLERPALFAEALAENIAALTAIGNDYSYDQIFERQVEAKGKAGDILMGLTTSGNSKNVVRALQLGRRMGMVTVGLTGNRRGTEIAKVADYCVAIPSGSTPRIQEGHLLLGHMLCEFIEEKLTPDRPTPQGAKP